MSKYKLTTNKDKTVAVKVTKDEDTDNGEYLAINCTLEGSNRSE